MSISARLGMIVGALALVIGVTFYLLGVSGYVDRMLGTPPANPYHPRTEIIIIEGQPYLTVYGPTGVAVCPHTPRYEP